MGNIKFDQHLLIKRIPCCYIQPNLYIYHSTSIIHHGMRLFFFQYALIIHIQYMMPQQISTWLASINASSNTPTRCLHHYRDFIHVSFYQTPHTIVKLHIKSDYLSLHCQPPRFTDLLCIVPDVTIGSDTMLKSYPRIPTWEQYVSLVNTF